MADGDIVIIGIGHCRTANGASTNITDPNLLAKAINLGIIPKGSTKLEEWHYNSVLARLIVDKLKAYNIVGITSNREGDAEIHGSGKGPMAEVTAMNNYIKKATEEGKTVRCAINLHLNATAGASGYEYLHVPSESRQSALGRCITNYTLKALDNIKFRGAKPFAGRGDAYGKATRVPTIILESFFVDTISDYRRGIEKFDELAGAIAKGLKDYCDDNFPTLTVEEAKSIQYVQSSALASNKITNKFGDEQLKEIAVRTQAALNPIERQMGEGGNKYSFYTKNAIEVVATTPIPFSSTLIDSTGSVIKSAMLRDGGICGKYITFPKYQAIDYTSNVPTGRKEVNVHSRYSVKTYETDLNSSGWTRINAGENLKLGSSQQIDMVSGNNINIASGAITMINSPTISFTGDTIISNGQSVDIGNTLCTGAMYVQGGISSTSFNGPAVIDKTNTQELYGFLAGQVKALLQELVGTAELIFSVPGDSIQPNDPVTATIKFNPETLLTFDKIVGGDASDPNGNGGPLVVIPPHKHYFKRLAGSLDNSSVETQSKIAATINRL